MSNTDSKNDNPPTAEVTRSFDASAERVFDAWLDSDQVRKWMATSGSMKNLQRVTIDARVGGRFSFVDRRDGQDVDHVGKYVEIERPRRLKFSWGVVGTSADESWVTIEITPTGADSCKLSLSHQLAPGWEDYLERTKAAWTKMLGGIETVLAAD